ncbi:MAG TPA: carboxypeptidase-like regulatory domain-containing protein, partial [Gaiellaceae bacterium]|nr:carboxypeptidase-like regulatory domain-containing protein [Gaiellaceae bacterium]
MDRGPPVWTIGSSGTNASGLPFFQVSVQDASSGLATLTAAAADNATVTFPGFAVGTTGAVTITITKIDPTLPIFVRLVASDRLGNSSELTPPFPEIPPTTGLRVSDLQGRPPVVEVTVDGNVLRPDGTGHGGALITATSPAGYSVRATSAADGTFSLGLNRGLWTISVGGVSNFYGQALIVDTTAAYASPTLTLIAHEVYISGVVTDATGVALPGVRISTSDPYGEIGDRSGFGYGVFDVAYSGADGGYRVGANAGYVQLEGDDLFGYYPAGLESEYTPAGERHRFTETFDSDAVRDLVFTLMPRLVTGSAVDETGAGAAGVEVRGQFRVSVDGGESSYTITTLTRTAADGTYLFRAPANLNRARINVTETNPAGYVGFHTGTVTVFPPSPDDGLAIVVAPIEGRKATATVSGIVADDTGTPLEGVTLYAYLPDDSYATTTTGADGSYSFSGDPGTWTIQVATTIDGFSTPWSRSVGAPGTADFAYVRAAVLTGLVTRGDNGTAVAGASIQVSGYTYSYTTANSLGEYQAWLTVDPENGTTTGSVT